MAMIDADFEPDDAAAVDRAERRLRLLERLTEIGMEMAEALAARVAGGEECDKDPIDAYAKLSRAIRLTIALEAKADQQIAELKSGIVQARDLGRLSGRTAADLKMKEIFARGAIEACVAEVIFVEAKDPETTETLLDALVERLTEDEAYELISETPLREAVERLCKDLCLEPDWSQWQGDGWAEGYVPRRSPASPFNTPSPRPILTAKTAPRLE
jgi:hypothetical protein